MSEMRRQAEALFRKETGDENRVPNKALPFVGTRLEYVGQVKNSIPVYRKKTKVNGCNPETLM